MRGPFSGDAGAIAVDLRAIDRDLLRRLPDLLERVGESGADPAGDRLDPAVYPGDPDADGEFRRLMADEMGAARSADRTCFVDTLDSSRLSGQEAAAWVRVIGDARLAIAARNGVVAAGTEWERRMQTEPDLALVGWLGYLQGSLVEAISSGDGGLA